ncbi:hypothetical protein F5X96DRAFT_401966 [Biscogniauxia mediterranea]|nr:hypothetical protein F5X96DRAFT_401966 [Biscogniauxia mediterranea]
MDGGGLSLGGVGVYIKSGCLALLCFASTRLAQPVLLILFHSILGLGIIVPIQCRGRTIPTHNYPVLPLYIYCPGI